MARIQTPRQEGFASQEADLFYRLLAEAIPLMVWTANSEGWVDFVNQHVLEYTGLRPDQHEGRGWKSVVHPEDWEQYLATWTRAIQSGERLENELRLRRVDGTYRWHRCSGVAVRGAGGRVIRWFGICTDIEDQFRNTQILEAVVEQRTRALRETERRFQSFMDHLPALAWIRDSQLRYAYVNKLHASKRGLQPDALLGQEASRFFSPELAERFRQTDQQVQREGVSMQYVEHQPSGRWLKVKFPFPDADGAIGVAGIAIDITERTRLEEALEESEQRFRAFMDNAPVVAWIKDASFRYTYVNRMHERVFGRGLKQMLGHDDFELLPEEIARQLRVHDEAALREAGGPIERTETVPYADNTLGRWLVVKFPLADAEGGRGVGGIAIDITQRVEAEEKARSHAADVHDLLNRLIAAQESERKRLATELHDLIGQNLTALGIELGALRAGMSAASSERVAPRLDAMAELLDSTVDAIRDVMTELRPPALEEYGLVPALRSYVSLFGERTGLSVSMSVSRNDIRLRPDAELALFRIVQEGLTNAAKHSGGTAMAVTITENDAGIRLTVEDDGKGFADPVGARRARRGGWGLRTMRERAQAHGGVLRIEFPERGTRLVVQLPCSDADSRPSA